MYRLQIGLLPVDVLDKNKVPSLSRGEVLSKSKCRVLSETKCEVLNSIESFIYDKSPHQVVTLNSLMYNNSVYDSELRKVISEAQLVLPDSAGIVFAVYLLTGHRTKRIAGIDLMLELCHLAEMKKYKIFLLGARENMLSSAVSNLKQKFPGLDISGYHHGYFSMENEQTILEQIKDCKPEILFVGLHVPEQEKWICSHLKELKVPVVMGVGGSFDVIAGRLKRAPELLQRIGFEWLFRFLQQPWRIARFGHLVMFVFYILTIKFTNILTYRKL